MKLDVHSNLKIESKIQKKKQQEFKQIGSTASKPGQFLFALNTDNNEVYKVEIQKVTTIDFNAKTSANKAVINPNHPILWAINLKNAKKKFKKLI